MPAAARPDQEKRRLEQLKELRILDTSRQPTTEAIVVAAASIANVPQSAITLIDSDRQWFKAAWGLGVQETHRDVSFCAHALHESPLIVEDAILDRRFLDNPLVTGSPHIRFYAGFALVVEGLPMGALCVIDNLPRRLSALQVARLQNLAIYTTDWMVRRARRAGAA